MKFFRSYLSHLLVEQWRTLLSYAILVGIALYFPVYFNKTNPLFNPLHALDWVNIMMLCSAAWLLRRTVYFSYRDGTNKFLLSLPVPNNWIFLTHYSAWITVTSIPVIAAVAVCSFWAYQRGLFFIDNAISLIAWQCATTFLVYNTAFFLAFTGRAWGYILSAAAIVLTTELSDPGTIKMVSTLSEMAITAGSFFQILGIAALLVIAARMLSVQIQSNRFRWLFTPETTKDRIIPVALYLAVTGGLSYYNPFDNETNVVWQMDSTGENIVRERITKIQDSIDLFTSEYNIRRPQVRILHDPTIEKPVFDKYFIYDRNQFSIRLNLTNPKIIYEQHLRDVLNMTVYYASRGWAMRSDRHWLWHGIAAEFAYRDKSEVLEPCADLAEGFDSLNSYQSNWIQLYSFNSPVIYDAATARIVRGLKRKFGSEDFADIAGNLLNSSGMPIPFASILTSTTSSLGDLSVWKFKNALPNALIREQPLLADTHELVASIPEDLRQAKDLRFYYYFHRHKEDHVNWWYVESQEIPIESDEFYSSILHYKGHPVSATVGFRDPSTGCLVTNQWTKFEAFE